MMIFICHISGEALVTCNMPVHKILEENNTDKYDIEYMQFRSNHVAHGIIALHRIGASEERIREFVEWYKDRMEPPVHDEIMSGDIESLKGKRVSFYRFLDHCKNLLKDKYKTIDKLIASELPKYTAGLGCSALHGTIHLGYGFSARNERTVCEALAYLHHSYLPLVNKKPLPSASELGKGTKSPSELLESLGANKALHDTMAEEVKNKPWSSMEQDGFQRRLSYLITVHGDYFVKLLFDLKMDVSKTENGDINLIELGRQVVDIAVTVYALHEPPNDFFILHGVTSAWSILQVLPVLNKHDGLEILEVYLVVLMATYVSQACPPLKATLNSACIVDDKLWNDIIARTLAMTTDEHIYKVVQVLYDMWKLNSSNGHLYSQAAEIALTKELSFLAT